MKKKKNNKLEQTINFVLFYLLFYISTLDFIFFRGMTWHHGGLIHDTYFK